MSLPVQRVTRLQGCKVLGGKLGRILSPSKTYFSNGCGIKTLLAQRVENRPRQRNVSMTLRHLGS